MRSRSPTSSAASGSSSSSSTGSVASALRQRDPLASRRPRATADGAAAAARSRAPRSPRPRARSGPRAPKRTLSPAVRCGNSPASCGTSADAAPLGGACEARRRRGTRSRRPRCGRARAAGSAIASSSDVLPAPEGPITAVSGASSRARTRSVNGARRHSKSSAITRTAARTRAGRATRRSSSAPNASTTVTPTSTSARSSWPVWLSLKMASANVRVRPGDVPRHQHGRAELAQRAREREHRCRHHPAAGQRQRDAEERGPGPAAEGAGQRGQPRVHRLERGARLAHQQRERT
mgnify:CR=1 FL=1